MIEEWFRCPYCKRDVRVLREGDSKFLWKHRNPNDRDQLTGRLVRCDGSGQNTYYLERM